MNDRDDSEQVRFDEPVIPNPIVSEFVRGQRGATPPKSGASEARSILTDPRPVPATGRKPEFGSYLGLTRVIAGKSECWEARDRRSGHECFLKVMPSPTFPSEEFRAVDSAAYSMEVAGCNSWFNEQSKIWEQLKEPAPGSGSLVVPSDFFLHERRYVKVYPKIDSTASLSHSFVAKWDHKVRERFVRSLLFAVRELHSRGVVHSDIKKENVLIVERPAGFVARLIDFDDAYMSGSPPQILRGTPELFSPEALIHSYPEEFAEYAAQPLSCASDLFSLALVLHEVFSGKGNLPEWSGGGSDDPAQRALRGEQPMFESLGFGGDEFRARLKQCLRPIGNERPTVGYLMTALGLNYE